MINFTRPSAKSLALVLGVIAATFLGKDFVSLLLNALAMMTPAQ